MSSLCYLGPVPEKEIRGEEVSLIGDVSQFSGCLKLNRCVRLAD